MINKRYDAKCDRIIFFQMLFYSLKKKKKKANIQAIAMVGWPAS